MARVGMTYDAPAVYAKLIGPRYRPIAKALLDAIELKHTDVALELGAGTGLVTRLAAPRVRTLLATDLAPAMLDAAREATRRYPGVGFALARRSRSSTRRSTSC